MNLKLLSLPLALILSLTIIIGLVKPDIDLVQEKRIDVDTKVAQTQGMGTLLSNIDSLDKIVNEKADFEADMRRFLPSDLDEERVVDMLNYLAFQSGVIVSGLQMTETVVKNPQEQAADAALAAPADGTEIPVVRNEPKVKAYTAKIDVKGGYEGIREFFDRASHMNRYHKVVSFSIEEGDQDGAEAEPGVLTGTLVSQFDYFPLVKLSSALNVPVFLRGSLNEEQMTSVSSWIRHTVPALEKVSSGRNNPFQQ